MSSYADFNVGTLKLNSLGESTLLNGTQVITPTQTVSWSQLVSTVADIADIADVVVSKEDILNKISLITDENASSNDKYPSVNAIKRYVDSQATIQTSFGNTVLESIHYLRSDLDTKQELDSLSLNIVADASSNIKYPSVSAVKTYVDNVRSSLLIVEGESTLTGKIQWSFGGCPMDGLYGVLLPPKGKIRRITGIAHGPLGNMKSINVNLKTYTLTNTTYTSPVSLRTIPFQTHPSLPMLYALATETENILPTTDGGIMLLFEESDSKDNTTDISIPPYVRFRLTIEYETHI